LWTWDLESDELYLSPRWCTIVGRAPEELCVPPEHWWRLVHPDDVERVRGELVRHLDGGSETFEVEHRMVHAEGRYLWVLTRGEAVRAEHGAAIRVAGSLTDITKQKLAEERLRHDALHDDLTGLPNRSMFMDHLRRTIQRARRSDDPFHFSVLFLDFDRFKRINDSLGHLVGDQLLIAIARRLDWCVRPTDTVARLGGDEFSILLEPIDGVTAATRVAERIHHALREPFRVSGLEVFITVSIGITVGSRSYERPEDVLRDADTAMYRAKAAGKARHEVFDEAMHARAIEQLKLEAELRLAVKRQEFRLLYQPVVALDSGEPVGFEAFARWRHPTRGLLTPASFLSVAEESGLIVEIGWWIVREACQQMKAWQERYPSARSLAVHVNLSGKELFQPELPGRLEAIFAETGLRPTHLVLDIPENVIMHKAESSVMILEQLKSLGLRIHLDDFGTGYSSLGYLHRFQIDALKIDHSFIRNLRSSGDNWKTVRAIVSLADTLGMDVIAEAVENEEQLAELRRLRCKCAQGSFFEEPLTRAQMEEVLARSSSDAVP
jgi:diguanylate cyclase (GGDEF)-like protein/PAS domain S-box-containing protein